MNNSKLLFCFVFSLMTINAYAQTENNISIGIGAGTTGIDAALTYPLTTHIKVRGIISGVNYSKDFNSSDIDYDGKLKLFNIAALADYHPFSESNSFANNFRITAGLVYNDTKVNVTAKPNSMAEYTINGTTYRTSDVKDLSGKIKLKNKIAPYIGIGLGNPTAKNGFNVMGDLGVMYVGKPSTTLHAACTGTLVGTPACDMLQENVKAQENTLKNDVDKYKFWPVARIMVNYSF